MSRSNIRKVGPVGHRDSLKSHYDRCMFLAREFYAKNELVEGERLMQSAEHFLHLLGSSDAKRKEINNSVNNQNNDHKNFMNGGSFNKVDDGYYEDEEGDDDERHDNFFQGDDEEGGEENKSSEVQKNIERPKTSKRKEGKETDSF